MKKSRLADLAKPLHKTDRPGGIVGSRTQLPTSGEASRAAQRRFDLIFGLVFVVLDVLVVLVGLGIVAVAVLVVAHLVVLVLLARYFPLPIFFSTSLQRGKPANGSISVKSRVRVNQAVN